MPSTHQKPNKPNPTISSPSSSPPSETEIYAVAKVAYTKLVSEASLKDQNLRRLVGHANLYDKLLDEYNNCFSSDEESETDSWDGDVEEEDADAYESLARQAYYTTALTGREFSVGRGRDGVVEIHEEGDGEFAYEERGRRQERGRQLGRGEGVVEEAVLCKVESHSQNRNTGYHGLGRYAEVEVRELEVFDE